MMDYAYGLHWWDWAGMAAVWAYLLWMLRVHRISRLRARQDRVIRGTEVRHG